MTLSSNEFSCPEKRLPVCCSRTQVNSAIAEEIRDLIRGPIDWDFLLLQAAEQSVTPLLCRQLSSVAADLVEPAQLQRLTELTRVNTMRSLVLTAELVRIMDRFASEGIQAVPYKGPILAVQAYGDLALREFEDLDIVVRQRDVAKANDAMISLGYRSKISGLFSGNAESIVPAEYMYIHGDEAQRMMVEIHSERTMRHFPLPLDLDDLMSRLVPVSVGGHVFFTFAPEETFVLLCVHGSKHFWKRLSWIADIAGFVEAHRDLQWNKIFRLAQVLRANRMVAISLALVLRLFDAPLPLDVFESVRPDAEANSLAAQIERNLLARQPVEFGALTLFLLRRQMLDSFFRGWRYSLRLATLPSEDDAVALRLPSLLKPLYLALRPFRLLRKYGFANAPVSRESFASKKASN